MSTLGVFGIVGLIAAYFFSLGKAAAKKTPKPELVVRPDIQPFISWRVVLDDWGNPDTVSMDINYATEKLLRNSEWVKLP